MQSITKSILIPYELYESKIKADNIVKNGEEKLSSTPEATQINEEPNTGSDMKLHEKLYLLLSKFANDIHWDDSGAVICDGETISQNGIDGLINAIINQNDSYEGYDKFVKCLNKLGILTLLEREGIKVINKGELLSDTEKGVEKDNKVTKKKAKIVKKKAKKIKLNKDNWLTL